jgi:hypothetical protein
MTDTYTYFLHPVSATEAARVPLPADLPAADVAAYVANPPADVLAAAERWPLPALPPASLPPVARRATKTED